MNKLILVFMGCLVSLAINAQAWVSCPVQEVVAQSIAHGALLKGMDHYACGMEMASYRSGEDKVPFERARGRVYRSGKGYRNEVAGIVTISDGELRVTLDSAERVMVLAKADTLEELFTLEARAATVRAAKTCAKRTTPEGLQYRLSFPETMPYAHMDLLYDAQGWLRRLELQWAQGIQEEFDVEGAPAYKPRVTITFEQPMAMPERTLSPLMDLRQYLSASTKGKPQAVQAYAGYQLIDTRLP